jgi:hypothetical protein
MHNMALLLQPIAPLERIALLKHTLKGIPDLPVDLPVEPLAVLPPLPLALVRHPIAFLLKHTPLKALLRLSGTRPRVRISAATSASRTSIQRAAMASEEPARSERRHHRRAFRQRVRQGPVLTASLESNAAL